MNIYEDFSIVILGNGVWEFSYQPPDFKKRFVLDYTDNRNIINWGVTTNHLKIISLMLSRKYKATQYDISI